MSYSDPVQNAMAVTPSDATDLPSTSHGLYIGSTGDVAVETMGGQEVIFRGVPAGAILPIRVKKLKAATTASDVVALW